MLLERPPYRLPTPSHLLRQSWHVSEHFVRRMSGFIVAGVVAVWLCYTPCLSTVAALKQESGSWRFTLFAAGWSLGLAWLASFVFYQGVGVRVLL
jgi:Fe2+ transport system protein B